MTLRNPSRLAIHRRSDEIAFLQNRLLALGADSAAATDTESDAKLPKAPQDNADERAQRIEILLRERDLADELLHTRQTEPLGETLQRRLAMAERICSELASRAESQTPRGSESNALPNRVRFPDAFWVAEVERQALANMLRKWWAWLNQS